MTPEKKLLQQCIRTPEWAANEITRLRVRFESAQANYLEVCGKLGAAEAKLSVLRKSTWFGEGEK